MMQVESLRQRLNDLKKASIELKSKVLQQSQIESLNVSEILTNIHPNSSNHRVSFPLSQMNNLLDLPVSRAAKPTNGSQNLSLIYSTNSSVFANTPVSAARNQDLILWNSNTSSHESSPSRQAIEQQIQKFRLQNDDIESKIFELSSEISELKIMESEREEQIWKEHLPFINKQGKLGIFLTKLHIKEYDFDKVDYDLVRSELTYDKFTFYPNYRSQKSLKLASIVEVKYLGDKKMRIELKDQQTMFLYIQFANQEERQGWDLAIVTNHKIVADKDLNKNLFFQEKQIKANQIKAKPSVRMLHEPEEGQDLRQTQKGIKRKGSSVRFNEKKFEKTNNDKLSHSSSLKRSEFSNQRNQLEYTLNGMPFQNAETVQNHNYNSSAVSVQSNKEKSIKDFMVFGQVGQSHQESRANTSKFNVADVNFQNFQSHPTFTAQQPPAAQQIKKESANTINEWQRSLLELKQGYFFTKYAKNGFKPHNKKIFVSSEEEMLICANSEDLKSRKAIRIENITAVKYPAIGEGIGKYVKNAKVQNFCVIEYQNDGKDHVIELGCNKILFIKRFSDQFSQFLRRKGLLIND